MFKNLSDKIVMNQTDISKFIEIDVKPMLLKSPPAIIIYGPIQIHEKFDKLWSHL